MLGKVWSQVGSVLAVDPTGTQDLAPMRPSGEWTRVTWPQTFGPAGSGSFLGPLLPALLALWSYFCPDSLLSLCLPR